MKIMEHPILGALPEAEWITLIVDGKELKARKGEMIAAVLMAHGIRVHRYTVKRHEPRGVYCGIGQCTDCVMIVNGVPNIRTCITPVEDRMTVETQHGVGKEG